MQEPQIIFGINANKETLSSFSLGVLKDILSKAGLGSAKVTSTHRMANDQARAMLANLEKYGVSHQCRLYGSFGDQVIQTYVEVKRSGASRSKIQAAMTNKIIAIGPANVSAHMSDPSRLNVIDIDPVRLEQRREFGRAKMPVARAW